MNLKDYIEMTIDNYKEKISHVQWNLKPHHVECRICGATLRTDKCSYSPEECGWGRVDKWVWVCHRCLCHRDFKPYIPQIDEDERKKWSHVEKAKR